MEQNKVYRLMALTAIVSIAISIGAFTIMKDNFIGSQGEQGIQGTQGVQGEQGIIGLQGEVGSIGSTGKQGIPGEVGSQGDRGPVGYYATYHPVGEYEPMPGIVNGDFSDFVEQQATGWYTIGISWTYDNVRYLGQSSRVTTMMQKILIDENQGIAFSVKSNGARLELHLDGLVLFYGDFRNANDEWIRVVVANSPLYTGYRELTFVVLPGPEGYNVWLDDVTLVEFSAG